RLMSEAEVPVRNSQDMRAQMQAKLDMSRSGKSARELIDPRHILVFVSGAFSGLAKIMELRLCVGPLGFSVEIGGPEPPGLAASPEPTTQDFIDFGFEAEFIGRLPVRVVCDSLSGDALFDIMKHSEGSLIRQYEREFEAFGIRAEFGDDA